MENKEFSRSSQKSNKGIRKMKMHDIRPPIKYWKEIPINTSRLVTINMIIDLRYYKTIEKEIELRKSGAFKKSDIFPHFSRIYIN